VINSTCANVLKGNCRGNKTAIDWEQENRPLPKRSRLTLRRSDGQRVSQKPQVISCKDLAQSQSSIPISTSVSTDCTEHCAKKYASIEEETFLRG